jgi:hypothetical protein
MCATARLGMFGSCRGLYPLVVRQAARTSIWNALLLAPFVSSTDVPWLLDHLPLEICTEMASHDTYSWPIIWSACERLSSSPDKSMAVFQAAKWDTDWAPEEQQDLSPEVALRILKDPASYPWDVLDLADKSIEGARRAPHLLDVAEREGWFELDD